MRFGFRAGIAMTAFALTALAGCGSGSDAARTSEASADVDVMSARLDPPTNRPQVRRTTYGEIEGGSDNARQVYYWKGVPFAQAPVAVFGQPLALVERQIAPLERARRQGVDERARPIGPREQQAHARRANRGRQRRQAGGDRAAAGAALGPPRKRSQRLVSPLFNENARATRGSFPRAPRGGTKTPCHPERSEGSGGRAPSQGPPPRSLAALGMTVSSFAGPLSL